MMGFEPIPRFSRERILSPLRLPFRHIGAVRRHFKLVMQSAKTNFALADLHLEVSAQLDLSKFATGRIRSGGQAPQTILTNQ